MVLFLPERFERVRQWSQLVPDFLFWERFLFGKGFGKGSDLGLLRVFILVSKIILCISHFYQKYQICCYIFVQNILSILWLKVSSDVTFLSWNCQSVFSVLLWLVLLGIRLISFPIHFREIFWSVKFFYYTSAFYFIDFCFVIIFSLLVSLS